MADDANEARAPTQAGEHLPTTLAVAVALVGPALAVGGVGPAASSIAISRSAAKPMISRSRSASEDFSSMRIGTQVGPHAKRDPIY